MHELLLLASLLIPAGGPTRGELLELSPEADPAEDPRPAIRAITELLDKGEGLTAAQRLRLRETRGMMHLCVWDLRNATVDYGMVADAAPKNITARAMLHLLRAVAAADDGTPAGDPAPLPALKRLFVENPESVRARFCLGVAMYAAGGHDEDAEAHLSGAIKRDHTLVQAHLFRAMLRIRRKQGPEALADLRRFLELRTWAGPQTRVAHELCGTTLYVLGRFDECVPYLMLARGGRKPARQDLVFSLVGSLHRQGRFHLISRILEEELAKDAEQPTLRMLLVDSLKCAGEFGRAVEAGEELARRYPTERYITRRLAEVHCLAGDEKRARAVCEARLKADPRCRETLSATVLLLAAAGDRGVRDTKRALSLSTALDRVKGRDSFALIAIAYAKGNSGGHDEACALLSRALKGSNLDGVEGLWAKRALAAFAQGKPFTLHHSLADHQAAARHFRDW